MKRFTESYTPGDRFLGTPCGRYNTASDLFQKTVSLVIDQRDIVVSKHDTPAEAIKERDKHSPNWVVHW